MPWLKDGAPVDPLRVLALAGILARPSFLARPDAAAVLAVHGVTYDPDWQPPAPEVYELRPLLVLRRMRHGLGEAGYEAALAGLQAALPSFAEFLAAEGIRNDDVAVRGYVQALGLDPDVILRPGDEFEPA